MNVFQGGPQVIKSSLKWIFVLDVTKFPEGVCDVSHSQEHEVTVNLTFYLQSPTSFQFISEYKWSFVQNLTCL